MSGKAPPNRSPCHLQPGERVSHQITHKQVCDFSGHDSWTVSVQKLGGEGWRDLLQSDVWEASSQGAALRADSQRIVGHVLVKGALDTSSNLGLA